MRLPLIARTVRRRLLVNFELARGLFVRYCPTCSARNYGADIRLAAFASFVLPGFLRCFGFRAKTLFTALPPNGPTILGGDERKPLFCKDLSGRSRS
jgi:hypothetical protein